MTVRGSGGSVGSWQQQAADPMAFRMDENAIALPHPSCTFILISDCTGPLQHENYLAYTVNRFIWYTSVLSVSTGHNDPLKILNG